MGLFDFKIRDGILDRYAGKAAEVKVPAKVRVIGEKAFYDNTAIRSVVLPEGVEIIQNEAFFGASELREITLPSTLRVIGDSAFQSCVRLQKIQFPQYLTTLGTSCFSSCNSLTEVKLPDNLVKLVDQAFWGCASLSKLYIPDSVTKMGSYPFAACDRLSDVSAPARFLADMASFASVFGRGKSPFALSDPVKKAEEAAKDSVIEKTAAEAVNPEQKTGHAFRYKTRADQMPYNRKYIFLHAAPEDRALAEETADKILSFDNGNAYAVWLAGQPEEVFKNKYGTELKQMAVFLPLVTKNYLKMGKNAGVDASGRCSFSLEAFNRETACVLPLLFSAEDAEGFNRLFGELHGITLTDGRLQINLEKHLESLLGNDSLNTEIEENAFSRDIFLSYRKKDRDEALKIMNRIHNTQAGQQASIWFDDFLVPGESFREQISQMMDETQATVLSVTPNLLESGNYVQTTEYPEAVKLNKKVIPVEAVETDRAGLNTDYPDIGECVPLEDKEALNSRLEEIPDKKQGRKSSPYELYLLGRAFLAGYRVEKDVERGLNYLEQAASMDEEQACLHLGFLYLSGRGVDRNLTTSAEWYLRAYRILKEKKAVEELYTLLYGMDGLVLLLSALDRVPEAGVIGNEFLEVLEKGPLPDALKEEAVLWKATALVSGSDIHFDTTVDRARFDQARKDIERALTTLKTYRGEHVEEARLLEGKAEFNLGELLKLTGDKAEVLRHFERAEIILKAAADANPTQEYRKSYAGALCSLGLLQRQIAIEQSMRNPSRSIELMQPARQTLEKALKLERALAEEIPTINNREGLAIALFNLSLVLQDKWEVKNCLTEALEIIEKLQAETRDGSFDSFGQEIRTMFKKRHIKVK